MLQRPKYTRDAPSKAREIRTAMSTKQRFNLTLEATPRIDAYGRDGVQRLRAALKRLLRDHGLRCVSLAPSTAPIATGTNGRFFFFFRHNHRLHAPLRYQQVTLCHQLLSMVLTRRHIMLSFSINC